MTTEQYVEIQEIKQRIEDTYNKKKQIEQEMWNLENQMKGLDHNLRIYKAELKYCQDRL